MKEVKFKLKSTNGYNISAKSYLPQESPKEIIIAVHGFAGDKESSAISLLAKEMTKEGFGVVCFDFPGHGESEVEADKLTIDNCINDIETIEEYIKEKYGKQMKIDLFATSFGAYITLLKIFKYNTKYNKIELSAPAIKMDKIFKETLLRETFEEFQKRGITKLGFDRIMNIPFSFYEELKQNQILKIYKNSQKILIIQGTEDDVAPIKDTKELIDLDKTNFELFEIRGADHRMKKDGELEKAINKAKEYFLIKF